MVVLGGRAVGQGRREARTFGRGLRPLYSRLTPRDHQMERTKGRLVLLYDPHRRRGHLRVPTWPQRPVRRLTPLLIPVPRRLRRPSVNDRGIRMHAQVFIRQRRGGRWAQRHSSTRRSVWQSANTLCTSTLHTGGHSQSKSYPRKLKAALATRAPSARESRTSPRRALLGGTSYCSTSMVAAHHSHYYMYIVVCASRLSSIHRPSASPSPHCILGSSNGRVSRFVMHYRHFFQWGIPFITLLCRKVDKRHVNEDDEHRAERERTRVG